MSKKDLERNKRKKAAKAAGIKPSKR